MIKISVDTIIEYPNGEIVLVKRSKDPFKDMWCMPGGMVEENETVEAAAIREAKEETNLDIKLVKLVGVFSDPERDPRGHYISITFHAVPLGGNLQSGSDAKDATLMSLHKLPELAFDHREIIEKFKATRVNSF
jgi:8-oxo-dGTP diphosphatase